MAGWTRSGRGRRLAPWAAVVLVLSAATARAVDALSHEVRPKRLVAVEPGLYRSGQISPRLVRGVLEDLGIRRVVWLLHYDASRRAHRAEKAAIERLGAERLHFPLQGDGTGKPSRYADAIAAVAEARRDGLPVLVHCAAGARRSAGVMAMYRLLVEGASPDQTWHELERFAPLEGSELLPYLNQNMREIAALLVERGAIERVPEPLPLLRPPAREPIGARLLRLSGLAARRGLAGF